jgi:dTDP-glucose 4,6-dehydratase
MLAVHPAYRILNLDKLTYAGHMDNLQDVKNNTAHIFMHGDIGDESLLERIFTVYKPDAVVNFAAESHVDRSISDPQLFLKTNILGTQTLLEACRKYWPKEGSPESAQADPLQTPENAYGRSLQYKYLQVSTDEVYGSLGAEGSFCETTPISPNSPYSASKASADLFVRAYHETYGMKINITRCSNNYGPYQYPEKLIPVMILNALKDRPLPVYGDGLNVRDWLYVDDHCQAIDEVLHRGQSGEVYNIGGNNEQTNIAIVKMLLKLLDKPESLISYVEDRLGHDRRYAIDASKIRDELGWKPSMSFEEGMRLTVAYYVKSAR